MEMSRLTRDGTAEPVSRDQILRHERGQVNIHFPVQLTRSRIGNLSRLILNLAICETIHTYQYKAGLALERCRQLTVHPIQLFDPQAVAVWLCQDDFTRCASSDRQFGVLKQSIPRERQVMLSQKA